MTFLVSLLFLSSAAWGVNAPDSVWVESVEDGFVTLVFTAVEGADGYRIYRMIAIADYSLATADYYFVWVSWGTMGPSIQDTIRARVATLDNYSGPMGVAAFVIEDGEEILSEKAVVFVENTGDMGGAIPTVIRKATWGQVKQ